METLAIWLVGLLIMVFAARYSYQTRKREIHPRVATWLIFLLGTGLSLATYAIAENRDFRAGILNTMDFASVATILIVVVLCGDRQVRFKKFEKWYLAGVGAIVAYGLISGNAWSSNIFAQVLIGLGYIPTIKNLIAEKKNTESFTAWGLGLAAGFVGLYPAWVDGNTLAVVYALRTILCVLGILTIMLKYELQNRRSLNQRPSAKPATS